MGKTLAYKILEQHLVDGKLVPGEEIKIKIDQTLTQDSTGTMVYLQLEAMDVDKIQTELSVAYIDHNTLQTGFENADDHEFIKSVAKRHGVLFSKPGNGICHQLHIENFGIPGKTLLGSDSHTPTGGGIGMIAIGAGAAREAAVAEEGRLGAGILNRLADDAVDLPGGNTRLYGVCRRLTRNSGKAAGNTHFFKLFFCLDMNHITDPAPLLQTFR